MGLLADYKYLILLASSFVLVYFVFTRDFFDFQHVHMETRSKIFRIINIRKAETPQPVEQWIDKMESKPYADYGDGSCPENSYLGLLTDIFREWDSIAKQNNISYFLTCGSLLGAWRNETTVPKDTDLDTVSYTHLTLPTIYSV